MNIVVLDGYTLNPGDLSWDPWKDLGNVTVYDRTSPSEIKERAKDCEVIITNKTVLNSETIDSLPKLRYIGVLATGYNVMDVEAAKRRGIIVTNIPAYSTMSVAQHVFAFLLAVTDHVEHYTAEVADGAWSRSLDFSYSNTRLIELAGKTIGILGMGNIGSAVANIALAFGMKVLAVTSKESASLPLHVEKATKEELLAKSDVISLHCPLTPSTTHWVNEDTISMMKTGVILINTGRGPLVDEEAVAKALKTGKIGAFCADVLSTEPPHPDNPLLGAPETYITPHIAWATKEARIRLMAIALENLKQFLAGNPVNVI